MTKKYQGAHSEPLIKSYTNIIIDITRKAKSFLKGHSKICTIKEISENDIYNHLYGKVRLGCYPDLEDNCFFAAVDIDLKETLNFEQRYELAKKIKLELYQSYNLNILLEITKSGGFHLWLLFNREFSRKLLQAILTNAIKSTTEHKITNGSIEIFPKGKKGTGLFLPYFGAFDSDGNFSPDFITNKKTAIVDDNLELNTEFPSQYFRTKESNTVALEVLEKLHSLPPCFINSYKNWDEGKRNSLTLALAGVCRNVLNISEDEASDIIIKIAECRHDEDISARKDTISHTYLVDKPAGCKILQGNDNTIFIDKMCDDRCSHCKKSSKAGLLSLITTVDDLKKEKDIEYLMDNLFPRGFVGTMFGSAGIGKTWTTLDLAIDMSNGHIVWGKYIVPQLKVLYMEGDCPNSKIYQRIRQLDKGPNLANFLVANRLNYEEAGHSLYLSDKSGRDNIREIADGLKPDLIIIDTFISFFAGNENESKEVRPAVDFLRQLAKEFNCYVLINHHTTKASTIENQKRLLTLADMIGSSGLNRLASNILAVNPVLNKGGKIVDNAGLVDCVKAWDKKPPRFIYTIESTLLPNNEERIKIAYDYDIPLYLSKPNFKLEPKDMVKEYIRELIKTNPNIEIHTGDIVKVASDIGIASPSTVKRAISELVEERYLKDMGIGKGTYYVKSPALNLMNDDPYIPKNHSSEEF